jgi:hypothetical protein
VSFLGILVPITTSTVGLKENLIGASIGVVITSTTGSMDNNHYLRSTHSTSTLQFYPDMSRKPGTLAQLPIAD